MNYGRSKSTLNIGFIWLTAGGYAKNGTPYLLQSAVFLRAIRKHVVMASIPVLLQDILMTPLAAAGKLKGYRRTYYE